MEGMSVPKANGKQIREIRSQISYVFQNDGWAEIGRLDKDLTWFYVMLDANF